LPFQPGEGFDGFADFLLSAAQLVETLQIKPELRVGTKEMREAQGGIAGDGPCVPFRI
jgi:hypothetical protein